MSAQELMRGTETAWKHAYRYRAIARRIWRSPAARSVAVGANLGYRFYAHHLDRYYNCDWGLVPRTAESRRAQGAPDVVDSPSSAVA
jgi:hypothetical protein